MEEVEWSKDVWSSLIPSNLSILILRLLLNRLPNEDNLIKRRDNIFVKLGNRFDDRLIRGTNNPTPFTSRDSFKAKVFALYGLAQHKKGHQRDSNLRPRDEPTLRL
jgi:hypothetical protein